MTVSPRGNVWLKHGELDESSWLDGYSVNKLASPGGANYRIHESRSAQIWSLYGSGLEEYQGGQWIKYPIPEIRAEFQTNVLRQVRQVPLVPGEREHILFLLPDRLMEYHSGLNRSLTIRSAQSTQLQKFLDMTSARDGGVWLTGARGLAKLPGPIRRLSGTSEMREYLLPEHLGVSDLQRPFEDDQGGLTMVADLAALNKKVIVYFDGESWEVRPVPGETLRQAWRDWDQNFWALTINSLLRLPRVPGHAPEKEVMATGQFFVRRLSRKESLGGQQPGFDSLRAHPLAPSGGIENRQPAHFRYLRGAGGHRLVRGTGLLSFNQEGWQDYPLPADWEGPIEFLHDFTEGRLILGSSNRTALFEPESGKFTVVHSPAGNNLRVLGVAGEKAIVRFEAAGTNAAPELQTFDGTAFAPWDLRLRNAKPGFVIDSLLALENRDIWLAGPAGVWLYRDKQLHEFGPHEKYRPGPTSSLLEANPGKIWSGEEGRISEYDGKSWSLVRMGMGVIHGMTKSRDGSVWVASSGGLYRFQKNSWVLNDKNDGLIDGAIHCVFEDRHGRVWAGGEHGLSLYFPEADIDPPRTFISKADNSSVASTAMTFALVFSGRDKWKFTEPERLLYSYRLDHGIWSPYTNQTTVTFRKLAAGPHQFTVRAMDRNWNEDPEGASFEFVLVMPWYKEGRLVAISALALGMILVLAALAVNRHRQLVKSYAEVGRIVAQRTHELEEANQALLHSQKMKALGTLAAGVAHDFNNILSIIRGSAQIIENNLDDREKVLVRASRLKTVVDQGTGLVKAMLGFSRVPDKEVGPFDVKALLEEKVRLLGDRLSNDVPIRLEAGQKCPAAHGSKELLQQILLNLILNAADAMDHKGEIVLQLDSQGPAAAHTVLPPPPAPGYLYIAVRDTGHGIPAEILPRIFEPFFTTKALSTRRGTGLGLSMVYELAKETGYGLMVESVVAHGTTFFIVVPISGRDVSSTAVKTTPVPQRV